MGITVGTLYGLYELNGFKPLIYMSNVTDTPSASILFSTVRSRSKSTAKSVTCTKGLYIAVRWCSP
jgi:hypothetical protein